MTQFAQRTRDEIDGLRAAFEVARPMTIGLEEELMVLDPQTLDLTPRARDVLALLDGDPRFQPELPAAQVEIVGAPAATVGEAAAQLAVAREDLARAARGIARFAGGGAHPFAAARGELREGEHYARLVAEFGSVLRRQLVFGLHVHVAVSDAERVLAVYNAVREYLPALAALGAGAPFHEGRDTGLASVRPTICDLLPRQGIPPVIASWDAYAEALAWGGRAGPFAARRWWWEARVNPVVGTIEVRVADAQATVADTAALAGVVHALIATLAARHEAGELATEPAPTWRIEENQRAGRAQPAAGQHHVGARPPVRPRRATARGSMAAMLPPVHAHSRVPERRRVSLATDRTTQGARRSPGPVSISSGQALVSSRSVAFRTPARFLCARS